MGRASADPLPFVLKTVHQRRPERRQGGNLLPLGGAVQGHSSGGCVASYGLMSAGVQTCQPCAPPLCDVRSPQQCGGLQTVYTSLRIGTLAGLFETRRRRARRGEARPDALRRGRDCDLSRSASRLLGRSRFRGSLMLWTRAWRYVSHLRGVRILMRCSRMSATHLCDRTSCATIESSPNWLDME